MARRAPVLTLALLVATYVAVFGVLTVRQHARFGTFGFDMGIHDQGIWLLSRFREPFVTVRGLHYFGHHLNLVCLLLVPAYWLGAGPPFLYLVETVALALAAVPVYLLARDLLPDESPWVPLVPAAAYLLYPTMNWINWWHFHPEALAVAPLLTAVWLARRERWGWFAVAVAGALSTKEDLALAVAALGVVLAVSAARRRRSWRPGAVTAVVGAGWYVLATQVVMSYFNGGAPPFYVQEFFPDFGDDAVGVVWTILTDPLRTWRLLVDGERLTYYGRLLLPTGGLALVGLPFLIVAGPQLGANALSSLSTTHDFRFHYSVVPTAAVFAATVHGLATLRRRWGRPALHLGLVVLAVASLSAHRAWSPSPAGRLYAGAWAGPDARHEAFRRALAMVPPEASLATNYFLVPHATHRPLVYEWPNPWVPGNWGIADRNPDDPGRVDWLVLDLALDQEPLLRARLTSPGGGFVVVSDDDLVLVARRPAR